MTSPSSTSVPARERLLRLLCLAVIVAGALQIALYRHGRDQGIYALVARTVLEGGMPYRDAFDFKPPGIFVVYAVARLLSGSAQWGIRAVEVLGLAGMVAAMVSLADRLWGERTAGWLAAALAVLVHAQLEFWHTAQPESFGGMLSMLGVWLVCPPAAEPTKTRRLTAARLVAAGAAFGATGLLKPPLAGGGAVLGLWVAARTYRETRRTRDLARDLALVFVGGVAPIALCLGWFAARGALADLHETLFVFTPHYTELSWRGHTLGGMLYLAVTDWLVNYASLLTLGLMLGLATWRQSWAREGVPMLVGIIAIQLVGVALQAKFFPYHYGAVWPFTALLAGLGWNRLWQATATRGALGTAAFVGVLGTVATLRTATKDLPQTCWARASRRLELIADGWNDEQAIDRLATVADVNAHGNRQVAAFLREHVPAGGSAFVWGFEPVMYDLAGVRSASRFIYNVPQRVAWASSAARRELMCELAANRPEVVVVESGDVFPAVTDNFLSSAQVLD
ncbi:MAG: hypothetical protein FJ096_23275, partial [Deltaproteobacteria bacterium]|nr:hypothetical protein [Deltaproteobacteria bacterium]